MMWEKVGMKGHAVKSFVVFTILVSMFVSVNGVALSEGLVMGAGSSTQSQDLYDEETLVQFRVEDTYRCYKICYDMDTGAPLVVIFDGTECVSWSLWRCWRWGCFRSCWLIL